MASAPMRQSRDGQVGRGVFPFVQIRSSLLTDRAYMRRDCKGVFRWCLAILIAFGYRRAVKPRSRKAVRRRRRA
jgi:hypothetical protein